jgi:dTDP-4-amino-4,6-dideoxygalactose transaminase
MKSTSARVPRFDYLQQYQALRREILAAVDRVFQSGQLILGPEVEAFEADMCRFLGGAGHAVGVGNGTDALAIALRALGLGPGDEVITVSNTAVATVSAIRMAGATPVFCDVDPQTLLMDPADAAQRISGKTRAILPVHLFGNAVDMKAILRLAQRHRLRVIEDCAQSCGTLLDGRATGTWGDVGCFSFYPTKNLGAYGDGGLCFTRDAEVADSIRCIRSYGCGPAGASRCEGVNSRLDEVQAAVLGVKLRHLPEYLRRRRHLAAAYRQHLAAEIAMPAATAGAAPGHHLLVIQSEQRYRIISCLQVEDVEYGIHYPVPIHRMDAYRFLGYEKGSLRVTETAADRILSLPLYPELPIEAVEEVCSIVNRSIGP